MIQDVTSSAGRLAPSPCRLRVIIAISADCFPMGQTTAIYSVAPPSLSIAFSVAQSRRTFLFNCRSNFGWLSTPRPQRPSVSRSQRHFCFALTRWSNKDATSGLGHQRHFEHGLSTSASLPIPDDGCFWYKLVKVLKTLCQQRLGKRGSSVALAPGRLRLATRPALTGLPPLLKMIGTVEVRLSRPTPTDRSLDYLRRARLRRTSLHSQIVDVGRLR
jgi:hypothetical protein